ncbi:MAG: DUF1097 domain-containing protein [Rouxiella aceris]|uniref:DUF1097 domain-containing protein n=1 Tax=Rouxiella aceris TaxID=2703884 RepID=UPI002848F533|nr:DUF1097 domain-containing protein [Rouxiella aceris]MDR3432865.1 DUF1097 domain-containing protein [Rouxiella aceris]
MNILVAIGISVGILAGIWAGSSAYLQLITFAGFLSWASFYAAGGEIKGLKDSLITNSSGVFWGFVIATIVGYVSPLLGNYAGLAIAVGIGAAAMVWQARIPLFGFIPGTFIGCSTYFATNFDIKGSLIGLVLGALLGYLSQKIGKLISKKEGISN